jgi:hypothetical protein
MQLLQNTGKFFLKAVHLLLLLFLVCTPNNVVENIITLFAKSSQSGISNNLVNCYSKDTVFIGINSNVTQNIDSVVVDLVYANSSNNNSVLSINGFHSLSNSDTLWRSLFVNDTGEITATAKAFLAGGTTKDLNTCSIKSVLNPDVNSDSQGPTIIKISGPDSGAVIGNPVITIEDSIFDVYNVDSVYWTMNGVKKGSLTSASNGKFSFRDSLTQFRTNVIVVYAQDLSYKHNVSVQTIILDYNSAPAWKNKTISLSITEGQKDTLHLADSCIDPNGDSLKFAIINGEHSFDEINQSLYICSPNYISAGNYTVKIKASDGSLSDTLTIALNIENGTQPPEITGFAETPNPFPLGSIITFTATAVNPENGNPVTIIADSLPPGALFDTLTGSFSWTPSDSQVGAKKIIFTAKIGTISTTKNCIIRVIHNYAPNITLSPPRQDIGCLGLPHDIKISVSVSGKITCQWSKDGKDLVGKTDTILHFDSIAYSDTGIYRCKVFNDGGFDSTDTGTGKLVVVMPSKRPIIKATPSANICPDSAVTMTVDTSNGGHLQPGSQWKWYSDSNCYPSTGVPEKDRNSGPTLTQRPFSCPITYYVRAEGGNCGDMKPVSITIRWNHRPTITSQPSAEVFICEGNDTSLTISATDTVGSAIHYQWYLGGAALITNSVYSGVTTQTLKISKAKTAQSGNYTCSVKNDLSCELSSNVIKLTVTAIPTTSVTFSDSIQNDTVVYVHMISPGGAPSGTKISYKTSQDGGTAWSAWQLGSYDINIAIGPKSLLSSLRVTARVYRNGCLGPETTWKK